jgi:hypothetical protein
MNIYSRKVYEMRKRVIIRQELMQETATSLFSSTDHRSLIQWKLRFRWFVQVNRARDMARVTI